MEITGVIKVFLYREEEKFFGRGPRLLLREIEKQGSLRAACAVLHLAYTKGFKMIQKAEKALGFSLMEREIGGRGGGGSILTKEAKEFLERYERYEKECCLAGARIYHEIFSVERKKTSASDGRKADGEDDTSFGMVEE